MAIYSQTHIHIDTTVDTIVVARPPHEPGEQALDITAGPDRTSITFQRPSDIAQMIAELEVLKAAAGRGTFHLGPVA